MWYRGVRCLGNLSASPNLKEKQAARCSDRSGPQRSAALAGRVGRVGVHVQATSFRVVMYLIDCNDERISVGSWPVLEILNDGPVHLLTSSEAPGLTVHDLFVRAGRR